jgi:hypothetical protein
VWIVLARGNFSVAEYGSGQDIALALACGRGRGLYIRTGGAAQYNRVFLRSNAPKAFAGTTKRDNPHRLLKIKTG